MREVTADEFERLVVWTGAVARRERAGRRATVGSYYLNRRLVGRIEAAAEHTRYWFVGSVCAHCQRLIPEDAEVVDGAAACPYCAMAAD